MFNRFTKFEEGMKEFLLMWFLASRVLFIIVLLRVLLIETRVGLQITNSSITAESYYDIFIVRLGSLDSTRISHIFFSNCFCHIRLRNLRHWWNYSDSNDNNNVELQRCFHSKGYYYSTECYYANLYAINYSSMLWSQVVP